MSLDQFFLLIFQLIYSFNLFVSTIIILSTFPNKQIRFQQRIIQNYTQFISDSTLFPVSCITCICVFFSSFLKLLDYQIRLLSNTIKRIYAFMSTLMYFQKYLSHLLIFLIQSLTSNNNGCQQKVYNSHIQIQKNVHFSVQTKIAHT